MNRCGIPGRGWVTYCARTSYSYCSRSSSANCLRFSTSTDSMWSASGKDTLRRIGGGRLMGGAFVGSAGSVIVAAEGIEESGGFAVMRPSDNSEERVSVACCSPPSLSGPDVWRARVLRFGVSSRVFLRDLVGLALPAWLFVSDNDARAELSLCPRNAPSLVPRLLLAGETRPRAPRMAP